MTRVPPQIVGGVDAVIIVGSVWLQCLLLRGCFLNRGSRLWRTLVVKPWITCLILIVGSIVWINLPGTMNESYVTHSRTEFVVGSAVVFCVLAAKATLNVLALGLNAAASWTSWSMGHKVIGSPISMWLQNTVEDVVPESLLWWTTIAGFVWALHNLKATTFDAAMRELWLS